ncbi:MAG: DegV family protein [Solobacterium sp.]|nr:DegV family protein [Solobacterium sp.]
MRDYILATASTADLDIGYLEKHDIPFIPYTFTIGDQVFTDDCREETKEMLYREMRSGKTVGTSAITEYAYYEFFKGLMDTGKDVIYVDMSGAISSSIQHAEQAVKTIRKEYPDQKIWFIDSYNITGGLYLFFRRLVRMHESGASYDEVVEWGETHKKEYIHRFMVDDLQWLRRGGRLSNASAVIGTLLSVKPEIYVNNEGELVSYGTKHGRKKVMHSLVDSMKEDMSSETADEIVIIHTDTPEDAQHMRDRIRETYPELNDSEIEIMTLGPTIASHVGPGFMAVCYHGRGRMM